LFYLQGGSSDMQQLSKQMTEIRKVIRFKLLYL